MTTVTRYCECGAGPFTQRGVEKHRRSHRPDVVALRLGVVQPGPGGLMIRRRTRTRTAWWCRFCDGNNVPRMLHGDVRSDPDLLDQWRQHQALPRHQHELALREVADAATRLMAPGRRP